MSIDPGVKKLITREFSPRAMNKVCMLSVLMFLRESMGQVHKIMQGDPEYIVKQNVELRATVSRLESERDKLMAQLATFEKSGMCLFMACDAMIAHICKLMTYGYVVDANDSPDVNFHPLWCTEN